MNLTIDIGNTYIKLCVFDDEQIVYQTTHEQVTREQINNIKKTYCINNAIISSVRSNISDIKTYLLENDVTTIILDHTTDLPMIITYGTPQTLGQDRIAAAIGANSIYPNTELLVIDIGTCITYDFVDANNRFLGGNIAPGYKMRLDAMHHFTNKLPQISLNNEDNIPTIGNNTTNAIKAGAFFGIIHEINGLIEFNRERIADNFKVVITGGGAEYFIKNIKFHFLFEPNLVLLGLNHILKKKLITQQNIKN